MNLEIMIRDDSNVEYIKIKFASKEIESLDLNSIFNSEMGSFPTKHTSKKYCNDDFKFRTCYQYSNSIRKDILNYRSTILSDCHEDVVCHCHEFPEFINQSGHVMTGDVKIISNLKVRKLFSKGLKFIEPIFKSSRNIFNSIKSDIVSYVDGLVKKFSINRRYFDSWVDSVLSKVKSRVNSLKISNKPTSICKSQRTYLEDLKDKFVLSSVDKASNNISITCKKFYLENIKSELENTNSYVICNEQEVDLVRKHRKFCAKFDIPVTDDCVPFLHMLPKFHKTPVDFRYIAAGTKSSLKPLSQILSGVFKLLKRTVKTLANYQFKFEDTSGFWIVDNKSSTLENLSTLNNLNKVTNVKSFDFKKLYTNLPHDKMIDSISYILDFCFEKKSMKYINVSKTFNASWSNKGRGNWALTKDEILELLTFLLDNIFVKFGNKIYRQNIGIPMGCDCAPFLADLFLFRYEFEYVSLLVQNKDPIVKEFKFCSRYIDDLNLPNCSDRVSDIICNEIYPKELQILQTNSCDQSSTFLDVEIFCKNGLFETKLYDKRRDFSFKVITLPNLKSVVPIKQSYGIFTGELFRICMSSSKPEYFIDEAKKLIIKLSSQNYNKSLLLKYLSKFLKSKPACLNKFWANLQVGIFQ